MKPKTPKQFSLPDKYKTFSDSGNAKPGIHEKYKDGNLVGVILYGYKDHNGYDNYKDKDNWINIVHTRPNMFIRGYIERINSKTLYYEFHEIYVPPKTPNNSQAGGNWNYKYKYRLNLKIGNNNIGIVTDNDAFTNALHGKAPTIDYKHKINIKDEIEIPEGNCTCRFYVKCGASGDAGVGCNVLNDANEKDNLGKDFSDMDYIPIYTHWKFADPYISPSNVTIKVTSNTTRAISVSGSWTAGNETGLYPEYVDFELMNSSGTVIASSGLTSNKSFTFDQLTHGTQFKVRLYVKNGRNTIYSSTINVSTKKLGCNATLLSDGPTTALASFTPTIAGNVTTSNAIGARSVKFCKKSDNSNISTIQCIYNGADHGGSGARRNYKITELIPGETYYIEFVTTDWYNNVTSKLEIEMPYPLVRIFDAIKNKFKYAIPYIYHNGKWCKAYGYIFTNAWKMNSYKTITDARKENNS